MSIHWLISISAVEANWNCSCCDLKVHVRGWKQKGPEHPLEFSEIHRQEMKGKWVFLFCFFLHVSRYKGQILLILILIGKSNKTGYNIQEGVLSRHCIMESRLAEFANKHKTS